MRITTKTVLGGITETVEVSEFVHVGDRVIAHIKGTSNVAELELYRPEQGWLIYPDWHFAPLPPVPAEYPTIGRNVHVWAHSDSELSLAVVAESGC